VRITLDVTDAKKLGHALIRRSVIAAGHRVNDTVDDA